jgi:hypothetical protein
MEGGEGCVCTGGYAIPRTIIICGLDTYETKY